MRSESEKADAAAEALARLQDLSTLWKVEGASVMHRTGGSTHRTLLTHVFARHSVGLTSAVVSLVGEHMYVEATPLVRQTLECAVTAAWTAITPNSVEALADEAGRQRLAMEADLDAVAQWGGFSTRSHGPSEAEAEAMAAFRLHRSAAARKFEERCRAFPEAPWLYTEYRWLSQYVHPTPHLLDVYIRPVPNGPHGPNSLRFARSSEFENPDVLVEIQVLVLLLALTAWDAVSDEQPNRAALAHMADDLSVSWDRIYSAVG